MPFELADQVVAILRKGGVDATRIGAIVIAPVSDDVVLNAAAVGAHWKTELHHRMGRAIPELRPASSIAPVASASADAEAIAVFILRSILAAGRKNQVKHPYVGKTQTAVSGL